MVYLRNARRFTWLRSGGDCAGLPGPEEVARHRTFFMARPHGRARMLNSVAYGRPETSSNPVSALSGVSAMSLVPGCAIVTGGGSGIGKAIAQALATAGAPVAVVDLLPEGGRAVAEDIGGRGGKAVFVAADVSRWEDV